MEKRDTEMKVRFRHCSTKSGICSMGEESQHYIREGIFFRWYCQTEALEADYEGSLLNTYRS